MKEAIYIPILAIVFSSGLRYVLCNFSYNGLSGPEHWGNKYNNCGGKHQSPININELDVEEKIFYPIQMFEFEERPVSGSLLNNGHTVVVKLVYEEYVPKILYGPLDEDDVFQLSQFHFHWGENNSVGSEDRINNISFPAELHMVFRNAEYKSFDEAVNNKHGIVVMAFFYQIQAEPNPNYEELCRLLNFIRTPNTSVPFINPPRLLDWIHEQTENYYTYTGSLTTPPCSEDVTWIDFATPIMISADQIDCFRRLETYGGLPLTHNFRPIQPLNNRTVYKSKSDLDPFANEAYSAIPFLNAGGNRGFKGRDGPGKKNIQNSSLQIQLAFGAAFCNLLALILML